MANDIVSIASDPGGHLSVESLSRKLRRTQKQLKVAVERFISLEKHEVVLVKRLDTLEFHPKVFMDSRRAAQ